jgi:hypothetical protein
MDKKVPWDLPALDPMTDPNQGEITGFLRRWKGFQLIDLAAKV